MPAKVGTSLLPGKLAPRVEQTVALFFLTMVAFTIALNPVYTLRPLFVFGWGAFYATSLLIVVFILVLVLFAILQARNLIDGFRRLSLVSKSSFICIQLLVVAGLMLDSHRAAWQQFIALQILVIGPFAAAHVTRLLGEKLLRGVLVVSSVVAAVIFWLDSLALHFTDEKTGFYRSLALCLVILLAPIVSWVPNLPLPIVLSYAGFIWLTILYSGSRMATLAGAISVSIALLGRERGTRSSLGWSVGSLAISMIAYRFVPHLRARFNPASYYEPESDSHSAAMDSSVAIEATANQLSWGRLDAWQSILGLHDSWISWVFGKGIGASSEWGRRNLNSFDTPLNEYLRIIVDFGALGGALLVAIVFAALFALWKSQSSLQPTLASFTVSAGLMSVTESTFIYIFSLIPVICVAGLLLYNHPSIRPKWGL